MDRIYLDYAASTPVNPRVLRAMEPYFAEKYGNPGSLHSFGQEAIKAVDESRETISKAVGADFGEIIFTGSATEANNLAIRGVLRGRKLRTGTANGELTDHSPSAISPSRIIVSAIEHESVLETARDLEKNGVEVIYLPVDKNGIVDIDALTGALNERTVLVSVMYANNEIGSIQPIKEIGEIIAAFRHSKREARNSKQVQNPKKQKPKTFSDFGLQISDFEKSYPLFHADAAQAFQFLDCNVGKLGVDLMTLSAHKIYGPKGVGALFVRKTPDSKFQILCPLTTGGGQEFGLRSGTENVAGIVGFAEAARLIEKDREKENERIAKLRDCFWRGLKKICPEAELNGCQMTDVKCPALPNILNVYFPEYEAQFLLTKLDLAGVAVSSGSACRSRATESSHVIKAMGYSDGRARCSIRFSFGRPTTKRELDRSLKILKNVI